MADQVERDRTEDERLAREVGRRVTRRRQAQEEGDRSVVFGLGMFGLVGWSVAIPTLAGIAIGLWLDAGRKGGVSWTLTLLGVGLTIGCINAWYWMQQEHRR